MRHLLLLLAVASSFCATLQARNVKGTVTSEKKSLSGVIVTDGTNFTTTSKNGSFEMNISDNAEFVYIVTPSGYVADWSSGVPQFYQRAEGQDVFHFDLIRTASSKDTYNILGVGDPQPRKTEHSDEFADIPLSDIAQTAASLKGQTVGIALGDICFDVLPLLDRWKTDIVRAGIPFYTAAGNHDHNRKINDDRNAIKDYCRRFGPENHAFRIGRNDLVIVLDNIIYTDYGKYKLGYTKEIVSWVKGLMNFIPKEAHVYIAQHASTNGRHYKGGMIQRYDDLIDALKGHEVTFMSGHNHTNGNFEYAPGVTEHNIAAVCGTWWDVYHCTDGTPRGYKVFTKKGKDLEWYYKSVGKDRNFQYEIYRQGQTRCNPDCIVVNVWDYDRHWSIEWKEDGKDMGAMKQVEEYSPLHESSMNELYSATGKKIPDYRQTDPSTHYFAARPSEGAKEITIMIKDRFGNSWSEIIKL